MYGGFANGTDFIDAWTMFRQQIVVDWSIFNMLVIGNKKVIADFDPTNYYAEYGQVVTTTRHVFLKKLVNDADCIFYKRAVQRVPIVMDWKDLVFLAFVLGVQPELLIDEQCMHDRYASIRNCYGMRKYKILFESWRQGKTPVDILNPNYYKDFPEELRIAHFKHFFSKAEKTRVSYKMDVMLYSGCEVLGLTPQELFMPKQPEGAFTKFMYLSRFVSNTDVQDAELLYAITRVLATKNISNDADLLKEALCKLVDRRSTWGVCDEYQHSEENKI